MRAYHHYIRDPYPKQGSSQLPQKPISDWVQARIKQCKEVPKLESCKAKFKQRKSFQNLKSASQIHTFSNNTRASRTWSLQARFTQIQTAQEVPELDICKPDSINTRGSLVQLTSDWQPKPPCLIRPPQLSQNCSRTAFTSDQASITQTTHFDSLRQIHIIFCCCKEQATKSRSTKNQSLFQNNTQC
jgi:hypothetical protein